MLKGRKERKKERTNETNKHSGGLMRKQKSDFTFVSNGDFRNGRALEPIRCAISLPSVPIATEENLSNG
jgi:hypothetical protein